jgi:hypothetical protein
MVPTQCPNRHMLESGQHRLVMDSPVRGGPLIRTSLEFPTQPRPNRVVRSLTEHSRREPGARILRLGQTARASSGAWLPGTSWPCDRCAHAPLARAIRHLRVRPAPATAAPRFGCSPPRCPRPKRHRARRARRRAVPHRRRLGRPGGAPDIDPQCRTPARGVTGGGLCTSCFGRAHAGKPRSEHQRRERETSPRTRSSS